MAAEGCAPPSALSAPAAGRPLSRDGPAGPLAGVPSEEALATPPERTEDLAGSASEGEDSDTEDCQFPIPSLKTCDFFEDTPMGALSVRTLDPFADTPRQEVPNERFGLLLGMGASSPPLQRPACFQSPEPGAERRLQEAAGGVSGQAVAVRFGGAAGAKITVRNTFVHCSDDEDEDDTPSAGRGVQRRARTQTVPARVLERALLQEDSDDAEQAPAGAPAPVEGAPDSEDLPTLLQQPQPSALGGVSKEATTAGARAAGTAAGVASAATAAKPRGPGPAGAAERAKAVDARTKAAPLGPMYLERLPATQAGTATPQPLTLRVAKQPPSPNAQAAPSKTRRAEQGRGAPAPRLTVSIRNTFLHIDEEEAEGGEQEAPALHQRGSRRSKTGPPGVFAADEGSSEASDEAEGGRAGAAQEVGGGGMAAAGAPAQAVGATGGMVAPPGAYMHMPLPPGMVPPFFPGFGALAPLWAQMSAQALQLCPPAAAPRAPAAPEARQAAATGTSSASGSARRPGADRTTVLLQNLPLNYRRPMLLRMLDAEGFAGDYDFVYLPMDFKTRAGFGYAFINLVDASVLPRFWQAFDGYKKWMFPSAKVCRVSWSVPHQGLKAHIKRYRNSPLMHESVPDEYRPVLFSAGARVSFPPPTKVLAAPCHKVLAKAPKGSRRQAAA